MGAIMVVAWPHSGFHDPASALLSLIGDRFDWGRLPWQRRITDGNSPPQEGRGFWTG